MINVQSQENGNIRVSKQESSPLDILVAKNDEFKLRFHNNLLFQRMRDGTIFSKSHRDKFLFYFQVWSSNFQKAMFLKTALCEDSKFLPLFYQHFQEELGHDKMLSSDIKNGYLKKDPVLEALCNWFPSKMIAFSLYEQVVVMNLCVEGSAPIFYKYTKPVTNSDNSSKHFQVHESDIDDHHEKMGIDLLEGLSEKQYGRLSDVLEESWAMLEALMKRLGELTIQE